MSTVIHEEVRQTDGTQVSRACMWLYRKSGLWIWLRAGAMATETDRAILCSGPPMWLSVRPSSRAPQIFVLSITPRFHSRTATLVRSQFGKTNCCTASIEFIFCYEVHLRRPISALWTSASAPDANRIHPLSTLSTTQVLGCSIVLYVVAT